MSEPTKTGLWVLAAAAAMGALTDLLLRATPPGLNVPVVAAALVAAALVLWRRWPRRPGWQVGLLMLAPLLAAGFAWRDSPVLLALDGVAVFVAVALAACQPATGGTRGTGLAGTLGALGRAVGFLTAGLLPLAACDVEWRELSSPGRARQVGAVARGLLIAVPLLLLFGGLLVAADATFEQLVTRLFDWNAPQAGSHLAFGIAGAWVAAGVLRPWLRRNGVVECWSNGVVGTSGRAGPVGQTAPDCDPNTPLLQHSITPSQPGTPPRTGLGITEIGIALGALDALFLAFVAVQFRYFFGGQARVLAVPGLTCADYARRGFFELVWVAALALPLLLAADWLVRGQQRGHQRLFRLLASALVGLLFIIMASALQRMEVYQHGYGLTELRFYVTAFMLWLAAVFVCFSLTVLRGQRERFATGVVLSALLAVAGLQVANPDAWIARTNLQRISEGRHLDTDYIASLSADAVPEAVAGLGALPKAQRASLEKALRRRWSGAAGNDWRTWNWSRDRARRWVVAR